jgi:hypothetical protein
MSQLTLTPEEDAIVADALRAKAASYLATYGVFDSDLEALIDKIEGQLPKATVIIAEPVVEPEDKAAVAAFMDGVPHEQFTHDDDKIGDDE